MSVKYKFNSEKKTLQQDKSFKNKYGLVVKEIKKLFTGYTGLVEIQENSIKFSAVKPYGFHRCYWNKKGEFLSLENSLIQTKDEITLGIAEIINILEV